MSIQNIITLIVAIAIVGYIVYLAATRQWVRLRETAYALMLQAERIYKDNQGEEKFNAVFNALYDEYLPVWLKIVLPKATIRSFVQSWYNRAKDYLDDGILNNSPG